MQTKNAVAEEKQELKIAVVTTDTENDLYVTLLNNYNGIQKFSSLDEIMGSYTDEDVTNDVDVAGIMILADNYPNTTNINITDEQFQLLKDKGIRLYVEYPENNDVLGITGYSGTNLMDYNRMVITDAVAMNMELYSLLYVSGARYVKKAATLNESGAINETNVWAVSAKVAGYDVGKYALKDTTPYILLEENNNVLVAATKFSQWISARYSPYGRYQEFWTSILTWLTSSEARVNPMQWELAVHSAYNKDEALNSTAYVDAITASADWYHNSGMVLSEKDAKTYFDYAQYAGIEYDLTPGGDGSYGILETFSSGKYFLEDGTQKVRFVRRSDCIGESVGGLAMAYLVTGNEKYKNTAYNAADFLLTKSMLSQENRANPDSPEYGLLAWDDCTGEKYYYYGDDNAKAILGLITAASVLNEDKWDQKILECIVANFRTTGINGFRGNAITAGQLNATGWETYYLRSITNYAPHFEALMWACYLWAYDKTGYEPFLTRTLTGIEMMMEAYNNDNWTWTNGLQQERAKMILPLAWLCRVQDTAQHRAWLDQIVSDLMAYQKEDGAIQEALGSGGGIAGTFWSNAEYGTHEAPVIFENGDTCVDNLYTQSFAFMGLNEAAAIFADDATLSGKYNNYVNKLGDFLVRTQQVSDVYEQFDGVWFRGFDYNKWETYGSDGDTAWGVWSTETGWTQAWILNTLSMRVLNNNIWNLTKTSNIGDTFDTVKEIMLSSDKMISSITYDPIFNYYSNGLNSLMDGVHGSVVKAPSGYVYCNETWSGLEGSDATMVIDLGSEKTIEKLSLGFLNEWAAGVRYPEYVEFSISNDNKTFSSYDKITLNEEFVVGDATKRVIETTKGTVTARYVKVFVKNAGNLPAEHSNAGKPSWIFMDEFLVNSDGTSISFTPELGRYGTSGKNSLLDDIYGDLNKDLSGYVYSNGTWSGIEDKDVTITVDLQAEKEIKKISLGFLNEWAAGVKCPKSVEFFISSDNINFISYDKIDLNKDFVDSAASKVLVETDAAMQKAQYIKIVVENSGHLPAGHENEGKPSWIFMDELDIDINTVVDTTPTVVYTPALTRGASNGDKSILDGIKGSLTPDSWNQIFTNGTWSGQQNSNLQIEIDFKQEKDFTEFALSFLQEPAMGIYYPNSVTFEVSNNQSDYKKVGTVDMSSVVTTGNDMYEAVVKNAGKGRYVRITINRDDSKEWFFFDEFTYKEAPSKAKLQTLIEEVEKLNQGLYTTSSWTTLAKSIEEAKKVLSKDAATAKEIEDAILNIEKAKQDLVSNTPIVTYSSTLSSPGSNGNQSIIDGIKGSLTPDSWNRIFANGTWSGQNNSDLQICIDLKEVKKFNYVSLGFLQEPEMGIYYPISVKYEVSKDNALYTEMGTFDMKHSKTSDIGIQEAYAKKQDVEAQYIRITITRDSSKEWFFFDEFTYETVGNTNTLVSTLETLENLDYAKYTETSGNELKQAIIFANSILANVKSSQDKVDEALNGLEEAYGKLVNIEALISAINKAKAADTSKYTQESVKKLEDAIKAAELVKKNGTAKEVEQAVKMLNDAYKGLKFNKTEHPTSNFPATGDNVNIAGLLAMMILALGAFFVARKKRA